MSARSVISLFTGIGGLDFGFEAAGFRTAVAVEIDPVCRDAIANNRGWPVVEQDGRFDIAAIATNRLLEVAELDTEGVDMLIGGPPVSPSPKQDTGTVATASDCWIPAPTRSRSSCESLTSSGRVRSCSRMFKDLLFAAKPKGSI
jgi:hypothetical protein